MRILILHLTAIATLLLPTHAWSQDIPNTLERPPADSSDEDGFITFEPLDPNAFDEGYAAGVSVPMLIWGAGSLITGGGLFGLGFVNADTPAEFSNALTAGILTFVGLGVAQLTAGLILYLSHDTDDPNSSYDAGYDLGWGHASLGYGALFVAGAVVLGVLAVADPDNGEAIGGVLPALGVAGFHIGLGLSSMWSGEDFLDRATPAETEVRVVIPILQGQF